MLPKQSNTNMASNKIQLEDKLVGEVSGEFVIPSYQRGYRWEPKQVRILLEDIRYSDGKPYCLQPVVVRKRDDGKYELIDGQQRLTTIYLLLKYIKEKFKTGIDIKYSLSYDIREGSAEFLKNMSEEHADDYIDFRFMYDAYKTIDEWFMGLKEEGIDPSAAADTIWLYFNKKLNQGFGSSTGTGGNVRFIWYEVQNVEDKDAISLFTRLNIGRIPLTNAELVKALFLCRKEDNVEAEKWQQEIALQWDTIERELHDEDFWNFLTRERSDNYSSRIDLIFHFMVPEDERTQDPYSTFYYFNTKKDLQEYWKEVLKYYYRLKEWYKKSNLYHKIGYLVASGHMTMDEIVAATTYPVELRKSEIEQMLDKQIKESINFKVPYGELRYDTAKGYASISRLLLLFNVVSVMNKEGARFPFKVYNTKEWSLEHIHPQHPEEMKNDRKLWREWVENHLISIQDLNEESDESKRKKEALLGDMNTFLTIPEASLTAEMFNTLSSRIVSALSYEGSVDLTHSLSNMALLDKSQNSALSNSVFDVKRRQIIDLDRRGEYIPYCTRMVFLKYYTEHADEKQMIYWSEDDRRAYLVAMNRELKPYLANQIEL